ncbi:hypothetical protein EV562_114234 [Streptomyces sp. BK208]|nr:hypothetical protein EV562_114234 [Streptomyces sp. BK208]
MPIQVDLGYQNVDVGFGHPSKKPAGGAPKTCDTVIRGIPGAYERAHFQIKTTFKPCAGPASNPAASRRSPP